LTLVWARPYNRSVPLYEYECQDCHFRFEKLQRLSDPPPSKCPECGGKISQLLSAPAVQFKGSGWYVTDYARKGSVPESKSSEKKAETATETKTETKTEAKSEGAGGKKEKKGR
jgi:putative FmdB family regulatory protein